MRVRDHLEALADKGHETAIRELEGPGCPDEALYLVNRAFRLVGRSGGGMGLAPLSHTEIWHWARLTETELESWEVDALILLDAAIREAYQPPDKQAQDEPVPVTMETPAWPTRKE